MIAILRKWTVRALLWVGGAGQPCGRCTHSWYDHRRINACSNCLCDGWEP